MAHTTVVSTEELAGHPRWRVFDCRHDLTQPELGEQQYLESHIPGALFAHLDRDLSARRDGRGGRHPLPYPGAFIAWIGQQGLKSDDQVVCYDGGNGTYAARLWWMLRWIGHSAAAVLDGGFPKWRAENCPVSAEVPRFPHSRYPVRLNAEQAVGIGYVERHLHDALLLDARSGERFRGEKEPIDPVAGHIPGALNTPFAELAPSGRFLPPAELDERLAAAGERELVAYCGSGVTACTVVLAAALTGRSARLYPGSWSEWCSLGLPVEPPSGE
jgi:thiosulfate/3-mercaptopyruvate sulfurtransferase